MKVSKNKILRIISCLVIPGLLLSGCGPKKSQRKRSYSDDMILQTDSKIKSISSPAAKQQAMRLRKLLDTVEPILINQILINQINIENETVDSDILMEKIITPLRDIILNVDYLSVEENRYARTQSGRYIMPRLVNIFNDAILIV